MWIIDWTLNWPLLPRLQINKSFSLVKLIWVILARTPFHSTSLFQEVPPILGVCPQFHTEALFAFAWRIYVDHLMHGAQLCHEFWKQSPPTATFKPGEYNRSRCMEIAEKSFMIRERLQRGTPIFFKKIISTNPKASFVIPKITKLIGLFYES